VVLAVVALAQNNRQQQLVSAERQIQVAAAAVVQRQAALLAREVLGLLYCVYQTFTRLHSQVD
jgi:hypothetical protein